MERKSDSYEVVIFVISALLRPIKISVGVATLATAPQIYHISPHLVCILQAVPGN